MNKINNNTLLKAQNIMFNILIEIDKICQKHNINYWLDGGTLLGAVRHKGFIPWDDDLDISMTLDDYNRFLNIIEKELPQNLFLQINKNDPFYPYDWIKIRHKGSKIVEQHEVGKNIKYNQGIFIDIFPNILISNSKFVKYYYKFMFLVVKLFSYKYLNNRTIREKIVKLIDKLHNKNNNILIKSAMHPSGRLYIEKSNIFPLQKILFNDRYFYAPNNYDKYLKIIFGDYMKLPPENKRNFHASSIEIYNEK